MTHDKNFNKLLQRTYVLSMKTTTKNSELNINYLVNNFPTSITGNLLHVYSISSLKNIHHLTPEKKFNKLLQGTPILN